MCNQTLSTELDELTRELDEAQRMIDHARKIRLGTFPPVQAALNRRQFKLDIQRMRVEGAKKYLANRSNCS